MLVESVLPVTIESIRGQQCINLITVITDRRAEQHHQEGMLCTKALSRWWPTHKACEIPVKPLSVGQEQVLIQSCKHIEDRVRLTESATFKHTNAILDTWSYYAVSMVNSYHHDIYYNVDALCFNSDDTVYLIQQLAHHCSTSLNQLLSLLKSD